MTISGDLSALEALADDIASGEVFEGPLRETVDRLETTIDRLAVRVAGSDRRLTGYVRNGGRLEVSSRVRRDEAVVQLEPPGLWSIVLGGTNRHRIASRDPLALDQPTRSRTRTGGRRRATRVRSGVVDHPGTRPLGELRVTDDLEDAADDLADEITERLR